jgi:hypothetical protein
VDSGGGHLILNGVNAIWHFPTLRGTFQLFGVFLGKLRSLSKFQGDARGEVVDPKQFKDERTGQVVKTLKWLFRLSTSFAAAGFSIGFGYRADLVARRCRIGRVVGAGAVSAKSRFVDRAIREAGGGCFQPN